jgi:predicted acylesterase/phospholipase RssA
MTLLPLARAFTVAACALAVGALACESRPAAAECEPSSRSLDAPTALVLSGGGAKGAYEAGVAATLVERGVAIRLVAGSSAGALNAAMIAAGQTERLEALWRGLRRDRVYALRTRVLFAGLLPGWLTLLALDHAGSLFDPAPLRKLIDATLDLDRVRVAPVHLLVVTSDLARREARVFDNRARYQRWRSTARCWWTEGSPAGRRCWRRSPPGSRCHARWW